MPRIKLTLEYDGRAYVGWQVQPNGTSVQSVLERGLERLLGEPVSAACAGRTDAGVHALGQVVCFDTARTLPLKAYVQGLNTHLPPDVAVVRAEEVPPEFDPRRWSRGKRYRYLLSNRRTRSPLRRHTHWEVYAPLDAVAMHQAAQLLLGRHDFSAFQASNCQARHPVRELRRVSVEPAGEEAFAITVEGTAFLKHMVRNIVGTLVEVGRGRRPVAWVGEVLSGRDRNRAGVTAPAHGLTLAEVFYAPGLVPGHEDEDADEEVE